MTENKNITTEIAEEEIKKQAISFKETYEKNFGKLIIKQNPITSREEVKSLLSLYYQIQDFRIGAGNRQFQLDKQDENDSESKKKAAKNTATSPSLLTKTTLSHRNIGIVGSGRIM